MSRVVEWALATASAGICVVGAAAIAWQEYQLAPPRQSVSLWPLPGLVLLEWVLLGLAGPAGIALDGQGRSPNWGRVAWAACGGLIALAMVGAFSIGPFVLGAALALGASAALANGRRNRSMAADAGLLVIGAIANFVLLLVVVAIARP